MKVVIAESASRDLDQIFHWISHDNPQAARSVIREILRSTGLLASFPRMGRESRLDTAFELVVPRRPYIVLYRLDEAADEVQVFAVYHAARDR